MTLTAYQRKRDFRRTPEPRGARGAKQNWSYVIQKHAASHLHYDLRLELDGVLLSWAVPKGPCLDPTQKRLAVHVEDHPLEYGQFEGTIPAGEYGGGTVMLWDRGTWEPVEDPQRGYRRGKLNFRLDGEKLQGGWVLVRRSSAGTTEEKNWLLIKERDNEARPLSAGDVLDEQPLSVASQRDLDEIASTNDTVGGQTKTSGRTTKSRTAKAASIKPAKTKSARAKRAKTKRKGKSKISDPFPRRVLPQLATLAREAPEGDEWLHEIKFDGYRMICRIDNGQASIVSRNQQDWTARLSSLATAALDLPVQQAILDGEVVAEKPSGVSDFQLLQNAFRERRSAALRYYVFDLLYLNGHSLTALPLEERKRLLAEVLSQVDERQPLRYTEHVTGAGREFFSQAAKLGLEGILCKRRDRGVVAGRSVDWLKVKCQQHAEFVIGGYTEPTGSRTAFGALLLGYYNGGSKLTYAGKVGTGFDDRTLASLGTRLKAIESRESPFDNLSRAVGEARTAHWVRPRLVAQVSFSNWTQDGRLRHPSFQGLREDKPAREVRRDEPIVRPSIDTPAEPSVGKAITRQRGAQESETMIAETRLTSPDKVLYPEGQITKRDLAQYYAEIAPWILPHVAGRPLVLVRCPEGHQKQCFYQKHPSAGTPENLRQIPIREKSKTGKYVVVDDVAGLVALVQMSALEIHAWGSRADKLERPDRLIFDLDPDLSVGWPRVVESARQIRAFLQELGLESFVKTTGGKGLHLVVPILRRHEWDEAKEFAKSVAEAIVAAAPGQYTSKMSKAARGGKMFIDYLRNGRGATAVTPYSTRARSGAPVSTPLSWKELNSTLSSDAFDLRSLPGRLAKLKNDPWAEFDQTRQSISAGAKRLSKV